MEHPAYIDIFVFELKIWKYWYFFILKKVLITFFEEII